VTFPEQLQAAYEKHKAQAAQAFALLQSWYAQPLPRVPGMDTAIRLAWRIECGSAAEEAAGREYLYRWHLALQSVACFGVPHTLGL
jgi:hypothetical protein